MNSDATTTFLHHLLAVWMEMTALPPQPEDHPRGNQKRYIHHWSRQ